MEILIIQLVSSDSLKKIMRLFELSSVQKIVFLCPRSFLLFSDVSVLKKIKSRAEEKSIALEFVIETPFLKNVLQSQKLEVLKEIPASYAEYEPQSLAQIVPSKNRAVSSQENQEAKKEKKSDKEKEKDDEKDALEKTGFESSPIDPEDEKGPQRGKIFFLLLLVLGFLLTVLYWISPKAVISLKPQVSNFPITQNIIIRFPDTKVPSQESHLPTLKGVLIQNEIRETLTFPTSGRSYDITNAYGSVTLFNETTTPKFLVPSRLSTSEGIIVRFSESVTIPPKVGNEPGKIVVNVVADEYDTSGNPVGNRGNLQAGTSFFFPALREELQELYYAVADRGPLVGGSTLTHYYMAEDDMEKTLDYLEENFRTRALDDLKKQVLIKNQKENKKYVLLEDQRTLQSEMKDVVFPEHLVGKPLETFEVSGSLEMQGVLFDQDKLIELLEEKVKETQDERKKLLYIDDISATYTVNSMGDPEKELSENWVKISVDMKGIEMFDFHESSIMSQEWFHQIKSEIAGKSKEEVYSILNNFPEIENVTRVYVAPFWSSKIPVLFDQIEFVVESPI